MAKIPTTVRLEKSDLNFAEQLAKHWGMSRSQCVSRIIKGYRQSFAKVVEAQGLNPQDFGLGGGE